VLEKASNEVSLWPALLKPQALLSEPADLAQLPALLVEAGLPPQPQALLGIGQASHADKHRLAVFNKLAPYVAWRNWVHPSAVVAANACLGQGTTVGALAVVQPNVTVGQACLINTAAVLEHDVVLADGVHVAPRATVLGGVRVGEGSLVGASSTVLPYLTLATQTTLGAGAVLTQRITHSQQVWVGVPAKATTAIA
jgi:sugar O-acyltransferase (sialic acid O-acetyltransferase NeuD family)